MLSTRVRMLTLVVYALLLALLLLLVLLLLLLLLSDAFPLYFMRNTINLANASTA